MPQGDPRYKGIWFISEKRYDTNELVIVKGNNNDRLFKKGLKVKEWSWLMDDISAISEKCEEGNLSVQYRSLQEPEIINSIKILQSDVDIELVKKARAMAPGQNIVLYEGNRVLGSGILEETYL